jgi:hypothetical protein
MTLPCEDVLRNEIRMLQTKILEYHTKAWKCRLRGDRMAMREMHRVIALYYKRIKDCQWAIEYVQVTATA